MFAMPKICFGLSSTDSEIIISHLKVVNGHFSHLHHNDRESTDLSNKLQRDPDQLLNNRGVPRNFQSSSSDSIGFSPPSKDAMIPLASDVAGAPPGNTDNSESAPTEESDAMVQSGDEKVSLLQEDAESLEEEDDLFGIKRGYFHPMLSLSVSYTDNLYNLDEDRVENVLTVIAPGIWMSYPRRDEEPLAIASHNSSAGGLQYMLEDYEATDRYELYLKAAAQYKHYSDDSELNDFEYGIEGMGRYNFPGGLTLQITDQYTRSQDRFDLGYQDSSLLHLFYSNLLIGTADWKITEKFRIKGDVSLFFLRYDDDEFDYLERDDLFLELYGYFNWTKKTSIFLNYKYGMIAFDTYNDYDSEQHLLYAGIKWDSTKKTSLYAKAGFQDKQYTNDGSTFADQFGLALEAQLRYRYSEKTIFQFTLYKKNEETDSLQAQDKNVWGASFSYDQEYTDKLKGTFRTKFEYADYTEISGEERDEWRLVLEPKIRFAFRDWINAELGYRFDKRDSTQDRFDYYSNTIFLKLNLEL